MLSTLPYQTAAFRGRPTAAPGLRPVRRTLASLLLATALVFAVTSDGTASPSTPTKGVSQKSGPQKSSSKKATPVKTTFPAKPPSAAVPSANPSGPVLQFGLYPRDGDAWWAWQNLQRRQPDLTRGLNAMVIELDRKASGGGVALRATAATGTDAAALCRRIVGAGFGCLVMDAGPSPQPGADKPRIAEAVKPPEPQTQSEAKPATSPSASVALPPGAPIRTPEMAAAALAKVTASPLPPAAPPVAAAPASVPAPMPAPAAVAAPATIAPAVQTSVGPTVTTVQTAAATALALAVPRPPAGNEAASPPDGTVIYSEEDARTLADIEQTNRSRGRLRAVVPDTRVDVMPATLKRESWNLCALTFDDGPHRTVTRRLLEVLNQEGVRATYFPVARVAQNQGELIREFIAAGHEIGNHSLTHSDMRAMNAEGQRHEIAEANRILRGFGANPVLFRPPYGRYSNDMLTIARDEQMNPVLWTVDTRDWKVRDADKIVQHIKVGAGTGSVLLMHSTYASTVEALPRVIAELRAKGCEFVTLSEWLEQMRLLAAPKIVNANMPVPPDPAARPAATPAAATARN